MHRQRSLNALTTTFSSAASPPITRSPQAASLRHIQYRHCSAVTHKTMKSFKKKKIGQITENIKAIFLPTNVLNICRICFGPCRASASVIEWSVSLCFGFHCLPYSRMVSLKTFPRSFLSCSVLFFFFYATVLAATMLAAVQTATTEMGQRRQTTRSDNDSNTKKNKTALNERKNNENKPIYLSFSAVVCMRDREGVSVSHSGCEWRIAAAAESHCVGLITDNWWYFQTGR